MPLSTNGWPVITNSGDPRLRTITIPGTTKRVTLRRRVAPVLAAFLADVHQRGIIDLQKRQDCTAGWNPRHTQFGAWSNHASGTAVDMRWDLYPATGRRYMNDKQIAAMHRLLDLYSTPGGKRIFGWGGDYSRTVDEMHIEVGQPWQPKVGSHVTASDIAAVRKRLGITKNGVRRLKRDGTPRRRV